MSIAEKLQTVADNQQKVYDAGFAAGQAAGGDTDAAYNEGYDAGKQAEYGCGAQQKKQDFLHIVFLFQDLLSYYKSHLLYLFCLWYLLHF